MVNIFPANVNKIPKDVHFHSDSVLKNAEL